MLIAESGASKIDWCLVSQDKVHHFVTEGIRCGNTSIDKINQILERTSRYFDQFSIDHLHFYCSGCLSKERQNEMLVHLQSHFAHINNIRVLSDLHAAAYSTFGNNSGLGIILGTGSVFFTWNGTDVIDVYGGKGFPDGDFAGGADLGFRLIEMMKKTDDLNLRTEFEKKFESLNKLSPNTFSASEYAVFAPFVIKNKQHPDISELINDALNDLFFELPKSNQYKNIAVIGSIGCFLEDEAREKLKEYSAYKVHFVKSPIKGLVDFHIGKKLS